jgi:hypothetical protein
MIDRKKETERKKERMRHKEKERERIEHVQGTGSPARKQ